MDVAAGEGGAMGADVRRGAHRKERLVVAFGAARREDQVVRVEVTGFAAKLCGDYFAKGAERLAAKRSVVMARESYGFGGEL